MDFCKGFLSCGPCFILYCLSLVAVPENLKYAKSHEWVKVDGDHGTMGLTSFAVVKTSVILENYLNVVFTFFFQAECRSLNLN